MHPLFKYVNDRVEASLMSSFRAKSCLTIDKNGRLHLLAKDNKVLTLFESAWTRNLAHGQSRRTRIKYDAFTEELLRKAREVQQGEQSEQRAASSETRVCRFFEVC